MAPTPLQHRRTHNTLLFQKLLNLRDGASPFTLILDTLEQGGGGLVGEFVGRAKIAKTKILLISYATLRKRCSSSIDVFIPASGKPLSTLRAEILSHLPTAPTPHSSNKLLPKFLIVIDTLNPLSSQHPEHLSTFLSSLLLTPQISLLATYHTDIPLSPPQNLYAPHPLTTLSYLATSILTVSSLPHVLSRKRAQDKSRQPPVFGLDERKEGVLVGLKGQGKDVRGVGSEVVVEMELRRKSGRGIVETFVLSSSPSTSSSDFKAASISLLDEHPLYAPPVIQSIGESSKGGDGGNGDGEGEMETTFSLGLTEKQRADREGVVLPYFDAQKDGGRAGAGEGGRILYEMGEVDKEDFDDEEDEI